MTSQSQLLVRCYQLTVSSYHLCLFLHCLTSGSGLELTTALSCVVEYWVAVFCVVGICFGGGS